MLERLKTRKNVVNAVAAFGLNVALVFLTYRVVIQSGGLELLGLWSSLNAWIFLIRMGDAGLPDATTRFVARAQAGEASRTVRTYIDTALVTNTLLFTVLALLGYALLSSNLSLAVPDASMERLGPQAAEVLPVMLVTFVITNVAGVFAAALQGLHRGYVASRLSIAGAVVQLVGAVFLVPRIGLLGLALAQLLQQLVIAIGGAAFLRLADGQQKFRLTHVSWPAVREMVSFSYRVQFVSLCNGLFEPLSKLLLSRFGDLHLLGTFELAYKTVSLARNTVVAGAQATFPTLVHLYQKNAVSQLRATYAEISRKVTSTAALVLAGVSLFAPVISVVWSGNFSARYWTFVAILSLGHLASAYGATAYILGLAAGRVGHNLRAAVLMLAVLTATAVPSSWIFRENGVAIATALALLMGGIAVKAWNERKFLLNNNPDPLLS